MVSLLENINQTLLANGANQTVVLASDMVGQRVPDYGKAEGSAIALAPVPINKIDLAVEYLRSNPKVRKQSGYRLEELQPVPGVYINRKMWDRAKQRIS